MMRAIASTFSPISSCIAPPLHPPTSSAQHYNGGKASPLLHHCNSLRLSWLHTATFLGHPTALHCHHHHHSQQHPQLSVRAITQRQGELVNTAWKVLRKDAAHHGLSLFLRVFEIAPSTKRLFSFLEDSSTPLEKNPHLKSHALLVFTMTCQAAVSLGESGDLQTSGLSMKDMGITHIKHNVVDEHFDVVKYALLKTLEEGLSPHDLWSEEMREAWAEAYDKLVAAIKTEMRSYKLAVEATTS